MSKTFKHLHMFLTKTFLYVSCTSLFMNKESESKSIKEKKENVNKGISSSHQRIIRISHFPQSNINSSNSSDSINPLNSQNSSSDLDSSDSFPRKATFRVVIQRVEKPFEDDFDAHWEWLCQSLGFFEPVDRDKIAASIFKELVLASEHGLALTSSAIAKKVDMSRGSVINHLNNLQRSGLVEKNGRFYSARSRSMRRTIEELQEDVERLFNRLYSSAALIDESIFSELRKKQLENKKKIEDSLKRK